MDTPIFNNVEFVKSISSITQLPRDNKPEIAFIGRSNVGKSSLINAICGRKNIAKISSIPGKTKLINYFIVNKSYYFVDLPGYGFARLPKLILETWAKLIEEYLLKTNNLLLILLLIDSRHEPMKLDLDMINWLRYNNLPFAVVLTKTDKISKNCTMQRLKFLEDMLPDNHILAFSSKNDKLKNNLSDFIYTIVNS
ncbi:MAG TPA: YihA family ribosome biogenesis GTP-binding protein [Caldithrix sp.]|nr:YihA family ribosome biogenesis GTP-binding protein [Calditrichaceae bacterium]HEM48664.1 YihA family ribosome biogenesis GTP-binding protein [Caldithrix sp.]